jgi:hypothetical protein
MPIGASAGTLDIENATLRSNAIAVLTNLVAGNDQVRQSGPPALEVYGDPSHGGNEPRLELVSNIADTVSNSFTRLTSNAGVFSIETGTSGTSDNGTITFGGFQNERLRITSDGNVGVGTTNPTTKFTLYGDNTQDEGGLLMKVVNRVAFDNGFTGIGLGGYATTTAPIIQVAKSAIIHERTGYNGTGNLMFCNDGTTDNNDVSNTHARMTITSTGNVGIGTTNPSSQLELYGAGKDLTFKYDTGITRRSAATRDGYYSGLENSIKRVGDRNIFDGSSFTPDTTHEILFGFSDTYSQYSGLDQYYPSYNEMRFKLWSPSSSTVGSLTDVMTLRGDGNVGIGSTSPGALLDLYGPKDAAAFKFKITDDTSNLTFRLGMKAGTSGYTDGWTTIDPNGSTSTGIAIFDALYVQGTLSVSSTKNFLIDHPLQPTAKKLVHAAVESPRVDLIYRGTTQLKDGRAIVNIDRQCVGDESCAMEDGTFEALCRDPVYYLQNTTDFNRLIGTIDKNLLTIISEDVNSIAIVNWMVVAERKDRDILESSQTNDNGRLNTEIIESSERVNRDGSVRYPST